MGRLSDAEEAKREQIEGDLALLGSARVYLQLVTERVVEATRITRQGNLLSPAMSDLQAVERLICAVQERINERWCDGNQG